MTFAITGYYRPKFPEAVRPVETWRFLGESPEMLENTRFSKMRAILP